MTPSTLTIKKVMGIAVLAHSIKAYGGVEVYIHSSLNPGTI